MIENSLTTERIINIVMCIDGTGSMVPFVDNLKANVNKLYPEFVNRFDDFNSEFTSMRVKVIVFRDYREDGDEAMVQSKFFELPNEEEEFEKFINGIEAAGGGDMPENGLEALYLAMKSDFTSGSKDRQFIVLFTDADALPLKAREGEANYPRDMVDEEGLLDIWNCSQHDESVKLKEKNKRLILYAPYGSYYMHMCKKDTGFNRCIFKEFDANSGLSDVPFDDIIDTIFRFGYGYLDY